MITSTIKTSGGTYPDIDTWEGNIADTDNETGSCESSADLLAAALPFNAGNTGAFTYLLTADAANQVTSPTHTQLTSKARAVCTSGDAITISTTGVVIEKIAIDCQSGGQGIATSQSCTLRRLLIKTNVASIRITGGTTITVSNVAILKPGNAGAFSYYADAATSNIHHTSIICNASGIGFYAGGTVNTNGCIAQGTTANNYFGCGGNYNIAQGTGAPGAQSLQSQTGVYTNATSGSEDLSLTSSTTYAIVNRSGFPSDTDTDIAGTSRPSTGADAGCWQNASAPAPTRRLIGPGISR